MFTSMSISDSFRFSHAGLPPMWPGFDSRTRRHMWVEFVVGSRPCSERFFSGYSDFPLSSKTNISKFQFDLESEGHKFISLGLLRANLVKQRLFIYSAVLHNPEEYVKGIVVYRLILVKRFYPIKPRGILINVCKLRYLYQRSRVHVFAQKEFYQRQSSTTEQIVCCVQIMLPRLSIYVYRQNGY